MYISSQNGSQYKILLTCVRALGIIEAGSAQALAFLNGGFEAPTAGSPSSKFNNGDTGLIWNGSDGGVEIFSGTFGSPPISAYEGNQWAEVQNNGFDSLTQSITGVTPGSFISFSFAHAARQGTGQNTLNFKIVESLTSNILFSQNYTALDSDWDLIQGLSSQTQATSVDFIFTALSTSLCPNPADTPNCIQPGHGNFFDAVTAGKVVPCPLPLIGAATALAYSRKIRRRINKAKS